MMPVWFFYHVPKTGGQTIRDHFATEFEADHIHLGRWDREGQRGVDDPAEVAPEARTRVQVVTGHPLRRSMADLFPGRPLREIVFVRDPATRIVSHFNWLMTTRSRHGKRLMEFDEFLDWIAPNAMTRLLASYFGCADGSREVSDVMHELSQIWLVARTENMDRVLPGLFSSMGLSPRMPSRSNVTGVGVDRWMTLSPDVADELRARNPLDTMVHAAAGRFEARRLAELDAAMLPTVGARLGSQSR